MKFIILSLSLVVMLQIECRPQQIPIIYTENVAWEYSSGSPGGGKKYHIFPIGDTIIKELNYIKLKYRGYNYIDELGYIEGGEDLLLFRTEGSKLYQRFEWEDKESIVFDASWDVGDTIIIDQDDPFLAYAVEAIDTLDFPDGKHRQWVFRNLSIEDDFHKDYQGQFIEGVGGLFWTLDAVPIRGWCWNEHCEINSRLDCFRLNGTIFTDFIHLPECDFGTEIKHVSNDLNIEICPNPAIDGEISIDIPQIMFKEPVIKIIDLNGRLVFKKKLEVSFSRIDLNSLANGVYLVIINDRYSDFSQVIIIE